MYFKVNYPFNSVEKKIQDSVLMKPNCYTLVAVWIEQALKLENVLRSESIYLCIVCE